LVYFYICGTKKQYNQIEICLVNSDEFDEYIQEGLNANEDINDYHDFLRRVPTGEQKRQSIVNMLR
jgi:hypothetical protein